MCVMRGKMEGSIYDSTMLFFMRLTWTRVLISQMFRVRFSLCFNWGASALDAVLVSRNLSHRSYKGLVLFHKEKREEKKLYQQL